MPEKLSFGKEQLDFENFLSGFRKQLDCDGMFQWVRAKEDLTKKYGKDDYCLLNIMNCNEYLVKKI